MLTGFCYTQFTDTYQESNGLLYADRTPKFPIEQMQLATHGPITERQLQLEREWRERMMKYYNPEQPSADESGLLPPTLIDTDRDQA
jgi:hypothetical protein